MAKSKGNYLVIDTRDYPKLTKEGALKRAAKFAKEEGDSSFVVQIIAVVSPKFEVETKVVK